MSDLCQHGLTGPWLGGVFGLDDSRALIFDADGTRVGVRQRAVPTDETRPPLHRRSAEATAPGYLARKRGEVIRSRMTVQQRHTTEWLGTFGEAGNGDAFERLTPVCQAVVSYLLARQLPLRCGVLRLDGEHGWVHQITRIAAHGLGYLLRCCDYQILHDEAIRGALAAGAIARIHHADSGIERELFDLPSYAWSSLRAPEQRTRLVIARRREVAGEAVSVGKLLGGWIYELVVTDRTAAEWDAAQVYTLYQARGAFETTLAEEDREVPTDRWVSFHAQGQEFWQILCQWVWNLRLRAGARAREATPGREPLDLEAVAIRGESVVLSPPISAPAAAAPDASRAPHDDVPSETYPVVPTGIAPADLAREMPAPDPTAVPASTPTPDPTAAPASTPTADPTAVPASTPTPDPTAAPASTPTRVPVDFGTRWFERRDAHTVICPAGVPMHASERVMRRIGECVRYQAPPKQCARCELSEACRGHRQPTAHGHRITLPVWRDAHSSASPQVQSKAGHMMTAPRVRPRPTTAPLPASWEAQWNPTPLWIETLSGSELRRSIRDTLRGHRVELSWSPSPVAPVAPPPRSRRAHRRLTWRQLWSRNLLSGRQYTIKLAGVPEKLAQVLGLPTSPDG